MVDAIMIPQLVSQINRVHVVVVGVNKIESEKLHRDTFFHSRIKDSPLHFLPVDVLSTSCKQMDWLGVIY